MKLKELSEKETLAWLVQEFGQTKLDTIHDKLPNLIRTSETMDQLIARVYETINVEVEGSQLSINTTLHRLDTRKNNL